MLRAILGSKSSEGILGFLVTHQEGYATEIAREIGMDLYAVQKKLNKFGAGGLLTSHLTGRTRIYRFDPGYPLLQELKLLIEKALALASQTEPAISRNSLPENFRGYFWDYAFERLSWNKDRELIIRRVLTSGSWEAIVSLRRQLGDEVVRRWVIAHRGRGLTPRQLRFWSLLFRLPENQVNPWVRSAQASPWSQR